MNIQIKERKLKGDKSRLMLHYYNDGQRWLEKLDFYVFDEPKNDEEKEANIGAFKAAELVKAERVKAPYPVTTFL
jgi:hypothetical protein